MHFQHFTAHFHHIFLHFVESISNSFPNSMRTWKRIHSHNSTNPPTFSPILRIIAKSSERETAESIRSHSPDLPRIDFFAKGFSRVLRIVSTSSSWHKWRSQNLGYSGVYRHVCMNLNFSPPSLLFCSCLTGYSSRYECWFLSPGNWGWKQMSMKSSSPRFNNKFAWLMGILQSYITTFCCLVMARY